MCCKRNGWGWFARGPHFASLLVPFLFYTRTITPVPPLLLPCVVRRSSTESKERLPSFTFLHRPIFGPSFFYFARFMESHGTEDAFSPFFFFPTDPPLGSTPCLRGKGLIIPLGFLFLLARCFSECEKIQPQPPLLNGEVCPEGF